MHTHSNTYIHLHTVTAPPQNWAYWRGTYTYMTAFTCILHTLMHTDIQTPPHRDSTTPIMCALTRHTHTSKHVHLHYINICTFTLHTYTHAHIHTYIHLHTVTSPPQNWAYKRDSGRPCRDTRFEFATDTGTLPAADVPCGDVCIYMHVYIFIWICMYMYIHACMYTYIHINIWTFVYIYVYAFIYVCI